MSRYWFSHNRLTETRYKLEKGPHENEIRLLPHFFFTILLFWKNLCLNTERFHSSVVLFKIFPNVYMNCFNPWECLTDERPTKTGSSSEFDTLNNYAWPKLAFSNVPSALISKYSCSGSKWNTFMNLHPLLFWVLFYCCLVLEGVERKLFSNDSVEE